MRLRLAAALCATLLLAGCSLPSMGDLLTFPDGGDPREGAPPARAVASTVPATPGAPDPFCASVAQQNAQQASFDAATQQRMVQRGYQQCVTMYRSP